MEVKGVNRFRVRAYQNIIASIGELTQSVQDLWKTNRLDTIPGLGPTLKQHLNDLFTKGSVKDFDLVKKDLPEGMFSLLGLRGIGAKKAFKLAKEFDLTNRDTAVDTLKKAAKKQKIRVLSGFGEKSEKDILKAITENKTHKTERERLLLSHAEEIAERLTSYISDQKSVKEVLALGSLRRRKATVGDLDIAVATVDTASTVEHISKYPEIAEILNSGDKGIRIELTMGVQVDIRVVQPQAFGALVMYFTGSKQHNVLLRTFALEQGKSLNEYGLKTKKGLLEFSSDSEIYFNLGLQYIPPELRQGKHEINHAQNNELPKLIELTDIKGDLHTHTDFSDGVNSFDEMVNRANELGYEYYGITDHAPSIVSRGKDELLNIIGTLRSRIEHYNDSDVSPYLMMGYEVNILASGEIALPNEILSLLDYGIAAIHSAFDRSKEENTQRILNALKNPYIKIIAHPTGRLINSRNSYALDWEKVFETALAHKKILEINAHPSRLDLPDDLVNEAVNKGILLAINTDAHSISDLELMRYGIDVARRGWCTRKNIVNTLPKDKILRLLTSRD